MQAKEIDDSLKNPETGERKKDVFLGTAASLGLGIR